MRLGKILIPVIVVAGIVVFQSLFVVQEISQAIVLQFGETKKNSHKSWLKF